MLRIAGYYSLSIELRLKTLSSRAGKKPRPRTLIIDASGKRRAKSGDPTDEDEDEILSSDSDDDMFDESGSDTDDKEEDDDEDDATGISSRILFENPVPEPPTPMTAGTVNEADGEENRLESSETRQVYADSAVSLASNRSSRLRTIQRQLLSHVCVIETEIALFNFAALAYKVGTEAWATPPPEQSELVASAPEYKLLRHIVDEKLDTHVIVAKSADRIIISFRGTVSSLNVDTDFDWKEGVIYDLNVAPRRNIGIQVDPEEVSEHDEELKPFMPRHRSAPVRLSSTEATRLDQALTFAISTHGERDPSTLTLDQLRSLRILVKATAERRPHL
ncbi:Hypothetical Protein FCC1311_055741 [Hondaea fermentalgiana]|uniref:Uncharacterized protein n=1 Tax=Hondaea fermentalgiana TaxID=2315210 RepID=A0A2R5H126_9STRA|nr:Hypothetical Protein FCC1311_055741 [Hondaea fermentalgiana]|eukprot:GBG34481.1 Hypothetical Protein FCC1311_055741 [Hondaea fermentalgiana]